MADTQKELPYLRFYYTSNDSLKDKDQLKHQAFQKYKSNVAWLFAVPAFLQLAQITKINAPGELGIYRYLRQLKFIALTGALLCAWREKNFLEKKWAYYNRFYPEPTQLQKSMMADADNLK
mmetsp:Transcript_16340/g.25261  ORF Transcript_16340/g.25261 Transcript_16340/m.25261 type:complete len:121 (+) Transcript_16340:20-382(+)